MTPQLVLESGLHQIVHNLLVLGESVRIHILLDIPLETAEKFVKEFSDANEKFYAALTHCDSERLQVINQQIEYRHFQITMEAIRTANAHN